MFYLRAAVAIAEIQRSARDGKPTKHFRLGEWVPFILVNKSGGATGNKQFENVASPEEVILHGTPVNLSLLYTNRLFPALFGQASPAAAHQLWFIWTAESFICRPWV